MKTEITIKAIGWKVGTVGWLKSGLENGTIEIVEGKSHAGDHGLWLHHGDEKSQCLALFDPYDLGNIAGHEAEADYEAAPRESNMAWNIGDVVPWTDAAWSVLEEIAATWINHVKDRRASDERPTITVDFQ